MAQPKQFVASRGPSEANQGVDELHSSWEQRQQVPRPRVSGARVTIETLPASPPARGPESVNYKQRAQQLPLTAEAEV